MKGYCMMKKKMDMEEVWLGLYLMNEDLHDNEEMDCEEHRVKYMRL
jgi:hypothetical protein